MAVAVKSRNSLDIEIYDFDQLVLNKIVNLVHLIWIYKSERAYC